MTIVVINHETPATTIAERVLNILTEELELDETTLTLNTSLKELWELDSLVMIKLLLCLEDEFGSTIPEVELERFNTVADVAAYIEPKNTRH